MNKYSHSKLDLQSTKINTKHSFNKLIKATLCLPLLFSFTLSEVSAQSNFAQSDFALATTQNNNQFLDIYNMGALNTITKEQTLQNNINYAFTHKNKLISHKFLNINKKGYIKNYSLKTKLYKSHTNYDPFINIINILSGDHSLNPEFFAPNNIDSCCDQFSTILNSAFDNLSNRSVSSIQKEKLKDLINTQEYQALNPLKEPKVYNTALYCCHQNINLNVNNKDISSCTNNKCEDPEYDVEANKYLPNKMTQPIQDLYGKHDGMKNSFNLTDNFSSINAYKGGYALNEFNIAVNNNIKIISNQNLRRTTTYNLKCPNNKTKKIAVVYSGNYQDYNHLFRHLMLSLSRINLMKINSQYLPRNFNLNDTELYQALAQSTVGGCLELDEKGKYNVVWGALKDSNYIEQNQYKFYNDIYLNEPHKIFQKIVEPSSLKNNISLIDYKAKIDHFNTKIKQRVNNKEIDLILAFGTVAGSMVSSLELNIPVLVLNSHAPVMAGIIDYGEFSNKPNIHVLKNFRHGENEVEMLTKLIDMKHKRIGVMIDYLPLNRIAQGYHIIKRRAQRLGIDIVTCKGDVVGIIPSNSKRDFRHCMKYFSHKNIDAVFLTVGYRDRLDNLYPYFEPLLNHNIFIYSQMGLIDVAYGANLGLNQMNFAYAGNFEANVINNIMHGEKIEYISQYLRSPRQLVFNAQSAKKINWQPKFDAQIAFDITLQHIKKSGLYLSVKKDK